MSKHILITNHSSSLNLGNAALLSSTIQMIRKILGEETYISILTNDPSNITRDSRINVVLDPLLVPAYFRNQRNLKGILVSENLAITNLFSNCDAVVVRGGDALSSVYGSLSFLARVLESYPSILFKKPLCFLGHTFEFLNSNTFLDSFTEKLLKKELQIASFVTVREQRSLIQLRKLEVNNRKMFLAPDVAFQLRPSEKNFAENILHKTLYKEHRSIIGVTNSYSLYHFFKTSQAKNEYINLVAKILDKIVTDFEVEIILLPHSFIPNKDDRLLNLEINERCTKKAYIHSLHEVFNPELAKALIGCFDMTVSLGRLHPIIHSVSQAIPCMGLDYSSRMDGFFDSLGMKGYSMNFTEIASPRFMETFERIWSQREFISEELKEKMQIVETKSAETMELFKNFLYSSY